MAKEQKQAAPPPPSMPPGYGCLGALLLPVGLWWLAGARRRRGRADRDEAQSTKSSGG